MGLRINTNAAALTTLQNLRIVDDRQARTFERLSTGLRINRASDDPTGLALSEGLRSQLGSLSQVVDNIKNASNLVSTAEASLSQVSDLLIDLRQSVLFALDGTASVEQVAAEQDGVNASIEAINRIAGTARYGDIQLLNGSSSLIVENVSSGGIMEVNPLMVRFNSVTDPTPFQVEVTTVAEQAQALAGSSAALTSLAAAGGDVILQITGPLGGEAIHLASGATSSDMSTAINSLRGFTGIYASGGFLHTEAFGTESFIRIEQIGGAGAFQGGDPLVPGLGGPGDIFLGRGVNAVATFEGYTISGNGNLLSISTPFFTGDISLNPATNQDPVRGAGGTGTFGFSMRRSGLLFQFGPEATSVNQEILGIPNITPGFLGDPRSVIGGQEFGGFLSEVLSGGGKDLSSDPAQALNIVTSALAEVSRVRSVLGSFVAAVAEPAERSSQVAIENLTASESDIRDVDFAAEVAEMTRNQIMFQSGISVLGQANLLPQAVLQLLQ